VTIGDRVGGSGGAWVRWRAGSLSAGSGNVVNGDSGQDAAERLELNSAHGRQIIGILAVSRTWGRAMLICCRRCSASRTLPPTSVTALLKAGRGPRAAAVRGQRLMRGWFHLVARQKSSELFVLNVLLITLGLAYITEIAGCPRAWSVRGRRG